MITINASPGQPINIILVIRDSNGARLNLIALPQVSKILLPNLSTATNFPANMTNIDVGIYSYKFAVAAGATAVGTYLVYVTYIDPVSSISKEDIYQVIVTAPFGNYSAVAA